MRSAEVYHAVDSHTEGMPTRVIVGGVGVLPGETMEQRRQWFLQHRDHVRTFLMTEPRGHSAMSGAILQPPTRPDADWGVLYIEVSGCLPMCGHGTIGVATVLVETGMVTVTEPVTTIRLDTPAGLVVADVQVRDGHADAVTIRNVPSFVHILDASVEVPGYGEVAYDLAFGGNFYALVSTESLGIPFERARKDELLRAGLAIMAAVEARRGAGPSARRRHPRRAPRLPRGARLDRPALAARHGDLPRLVRSIAVRNGHQRPHGTAARARRAAPAHRLRQRVLHRNDVRRAARRTDRGRGHPRSGPDHHRSRLGHRHRAVHA
ncbi:proline racemase [Microbacterium trichothecenolyticum]|uniref:Proline racemase n=1 Tax=Microbacterium trichothecenolyticum TaxID=69370 RepID=A0ABU0TS68_MICTR|nr:proline racemase [Microbacterium trichothecenolyticum]